MFISRGRGDRSRCFCNALMDRTILVIIIVCVDAFYLRSVVAAWDIILELHTIKVESNI